MAQGNAFLNKMVGAVAGLGEILAIGAAVEQLPYGAGTIAGKAGVFTNGSGGNGSSSTPSLYAVSTTCQVSGRYKITLYGARSSVAINNNTVYTNEGDLTTVPDSYVTDISSGDVVTINGLAAGPWMMFITPA